MLSAELACNMATQIGWVARADAGCGRGGWGRVFEPPVLEFNVHRAGGDEASTPATLIIVPDAGATVTESSTWPCK